MPTLPDDEARALLATVHPDWQLLGSELRVPKIRRAIQCANFVGALALANRIGFVAEEEGHHPDLHVHYGRLVVDVTTHAAKGLTRNDFILAAKIDALL